MENLEIVNLVATSDLFQKVDLIKFSKLKHVIFNQEKYGGKVAYLKSPDMYGKVSIFNTGKLISVGTKSLEHVKIDLTQTEKYLTKNSLIEPVKINIILRNIVAVFREPFKIDLETLSNNETSIYEPEQFSGVILKKDKPKSSFLVFASGSIVITGANSYEKLNLAAKIIHNIVIKYT